MLCRISRSYFIFHLVLVIDMFNLASVCTVHVHLENLTTNNTEEKYCDTMEMHIGMHAFIPTGTHRVTSAPLCENEEVRLRCQGTDGSRALNSPVTLIKWH